MKKIAVLVSVLLIMATVLASQASAQTFKEPSNFEYPFAVKSLYPTYNVNSMGDLVWNNPFWYVLATGIQHGGSNYYLTITKYDSSWAEQTTWSFAFNPNYYIFQCHDFHALNNTYLEFICEQTPTIGAVYNIPQYYVFNTVTGGLTQISSTTYFGIFFTGTGAWMGSRLSNWGRGVTGNYDEHVAFINPTTGVPNRLRNFGTGSEDRDIYPMPTLSSLYRIYPVNTYSPSGLGCFHDGGTDCGSYLVYTATTPSDANRRLYVNEYSYGLCIFNPSHFCYFSGEFNLYHYKKLITDQQIGNFEVFVATNNNHYEIMYQDYDTGYWWMALFDQQWNLVNKYQIQKVYGAPYLSRLTPDLTQSTIFYINDYNATFLNYNLTGFPQYTKFKWQVLASANNNPSTIYVNVTVLEVGNYSNNYTTTSSYSWSGSTHTGGDLILPFSLQQKNLDVNIYVYETTFGLATHTARIDFIWDLGGVGQDVDYKQGLESFRYILFNGFEFDSTTYRTNFVVAETLGCTCNAWGAGACVGNYRQYTRVCFPSACDMEVNYTYDPLCAGGVCTPQYVCYNSSAVCLQTGNCTVDTNNCIFCPYTCNFGTDSCYGSPTCSPCPNGGMTQQPFPDCSCSCSNFCSLGYENITASCACKSEAINTTTWQDNPAQMFADISSGLVGMMSTLLVPLIILMLAIGFASVIVMIGKRGIK
jgi:hypothetical protein